ncbi:MAG: tetraacyldisaccharide 4'-kinase [Alphaproteobacteria bacterium]
MMKAPAFWWREPGVVAHLLSPLAGLYGAVAASRMAQKGVKAPCPLICVGNFVAGGAGKTPVALALATLLKAQGEKPVFLSRGHGGALSGPVLVDGVKHGPHDVGDEPLLLAAVAPTIVAHDRVAGAMLSAKHGSVIIMDDGMQNPSLQKDLTIAVIDAGQGIGNGLCLPAGPLRAPLKAQIPLVDLCVSVGGQAPDTIVHAFNDRLMRANLVPDAGMADALKGRSVYAFCGIGRPEKFEQTLRDCGVKVTKMESFPDHHLFSRIEVERLIAEARRLHALPLTTVKDHVRVVAAAPDLADKIAVLPVTLVFDHEEALIKILKSRLI